MVTVACNSAPEPVATEEQPIQTDAIPTEVLEEPASAPDVPLPFPCPLAHGLSATVIGKVSQISLPFDGNFLRLLPLQNTEEQIGLGILRGDSCYVIGAGFPVAESPDYQDLRWLYDYEILQSGTVIESAVVDEHGDLSYEEVERWPLPADGIRFFPDETGGFAILYFSGDTLKWYAGE